MSPHHLRVASRRRFLQFLAAGPLLTAGGTVAFAQGLPVRPADPVIWAPRDIDALIADPKQALDVFDFEPVARKNLPPAHFGLMVTGVDDEVTLRANREGFQKFQLRPRRLVDVSTIDTRVEILGATYDSPIVIAPTGGNRAFHPDGEIAVAKAAKAGNHLQMLATGASTSIEDAIAARGAPVWFQLYPTNKWEVAAALVTRAEQAGSPVIALTVDTLSAQKWETLARLRRTDTRQCADCHAGSFQDFVARRPNFDGIDIAGVTRLGANSINWDFIKKLRDTVKAKIVLKGIVAHEDAGLAASAGIDAIIVSNHGGRSMDYGPSTLEVLPEIVTAVNGRIPVIVDSGFRRGSDVFKALALGASAVELGRAARWGLGAFGAAGTQRLLEIVQAELVQAASFAGAANLKAINKSMVKTNFV